MVSTRFPVFILKDTKKRGHTSVSKQQTGSKSAAVVGPGFLRSDEDAAALTLSTSDLVLEFPLPAGSQG